MISARSSMRLVREDAPAPRALPPVAISVIQQLANLQDEIQDLNLEINNLRRRDETLHEFGDCRLDTEARTLTRAGKEVALSPKEFELLAYFVSNAGRALNRDTIMASVWGYDAMVTPRSIDRFVTVLRQKIEPEPGEPRFIKTVREFGYKFDADAV